MKLQNTEIFSRQTLVSWRILVAMSAILIAIKYFDYNTDAWPVLSRDVSPEEFKIISSVTVLFLLTSYLVNWYGDYVGFTKWFKINSITKNSIDELSAAKNAEPPIQGVERRLKQLQRTNETASERTLELEAISLDDLKAIQGDRNIALDLQNLRSTVSNNGEVIDQLAREIGDLKSLLLDLGANFQTISKIALFLLYGWYLIVPVSIALIALLMC